MALPGRCATINAPTTMNTMNANSSAALSARGSWWKVPLLTESTYKRITLTAKTASMNQASQIERVRTGPSPPLKPRTHQAHDGQRRLGSSAHRPAVSGGERPKIVTSRITEQA